MDRDVIKEIEQEKQRLREVVAQEEEQVVNELNYKIKMGLTIGGLALLAGSLAVIMGNWLAGEEDEGIPESEPKQVEKLPVMVAETVQEETVPLSEESVDAPNPFWEEAKKALMLFLLEAAKEELIMLLEDLSETREDED